MYDKVRGSDEAIFLQEEYYLQTKTFVVHIFWKDYLSAWNSFEVTFKVGLSSMGFYDFL